MHISKAYSVLFLIFTYQTGARILIYYTGKMYTELNLNCLKKKLKDKDIAFEGQSQIHMTVQIYTRSKLILV